jgi:hypothetical protein
VTLIVGHHAGPADAARGLLGLKLPELVATQAHCRGCDQRIAILVHPRD